MKKIFVLLFLINQLAHAQIKQIVQFDSKGGGGGDASEMRVNEIRADLAKWIQDGGSKELKLPVGISLDEYNSKMITLLQPKYTRIIFVEKGTNSKPELTVDIDGSPKSCRSYFSQKDNKPIILCVISRFVNMSEARQYRLIHHEYAGLGMLERNHGAESDYEISNQITSFLKVEEVLRLSVKREGQVKGSLTTLEFLTVYEENLIINLKKICHHSSLNELAFLIKASRAKLAEVDNVSGILGYEKLNKLYRKELQNMAYHYLIWEFRGNCVNSSDYLKGAVFRAIETSISSFNSNYKKLSTKQKRRLRRRSKGRIITLLNFKN